MRARFLVAIGVLALSAGRGGAETLGDILTAQGLSAAGDAVSHLDEAVQAYAVLEDGGDFVVVYTAGEDQSAGLYATRFERASGAWHTARLEWRGAGANALPADECRSGLSIARFAGGLLVRAHINPSAECTIVLGRDLAVRAVLAGWPEVILADGRIVYQRNQVHFASFHPVGLALFDARRPAPVTLYPRKPYQRVRAAHIARMRAVYTPAWCNLHNHPCDPDQFDEHLISEVTTDTRGDALAFVIAWDNTAGWTDTERWGRLEAFRELRAVLTTWNGQGAPPAELYRGLATGLARVRNLKNEVHVTSALVGEPMLRDLVAAALATPRAAGQDERSWLVALDARWADATTWRRLGDAVAVPDEFTEVVYVYTGLRRPETMRYREMPRRDFEARFGWDAPARALEPDVLRRIFASPPD